MTNQITYVAATLCFACATPLISETKISTAQDAQIAYVAALNSNSLNQFLNAVTDDFVLVTPDAPLLEGKAAVAPWVTAYFGTVQTSWQKQTLEFVVVADWAFERYAFTATDISYGSGLANVTTGHGINLYRRENDGYWRVARDIWSLSARDARPDEAHGVSTCSTDITPC